MSGTLLFPLVLWKEPGFPRFPGSFHGTGGESGALDVFCSLLLTGPVSRKTHLNYISNIGDRACVLQQLTMEMKSEVDATEHNGVKEEEGVNSSEHNCVKEEGVNSSEHNGVKEEGVNSSEHNGVKEEEVDKGKKSHACPYESCGQVFSRPWRLASHICYHTGQRPHMCTVPGCEKAYFNASHLRRHIATRHTPPSASKSLYKCHFPGCLMELSNLHNLKRHYYRIHERGKPFTCEYCGKGYYKRSLWEGHLFEHIGIKCPECNVMFTSQRDLKRHQRGHNIYTCDVPNCGEIFERWAHLRTHLALQHPEDFRCGVCDKSFRAKCRLQDHMTVHEDPSHRPKLSCPIGSCTRVYYHKRNLTQHMRWSHPELCNNLQVLLFQAETPGMEDGVVIDDSAAPSTHDVDKIKMEPTSEDEETLPFCEVLMSEIKREPLNEDSEESSDGPEMKQDAETYLHGSEQILGSS